MHRGTPSANIHVRCAFLYDCSAMSKRRSDVLAFLNNPLQGLSNWAIQVPGLCPSL